MIIIKIFKHLFINKILNDYIENWDKTFLWKKSESNMGHFDLLYKLKVFWGFIIVCLFIYCIQGLILKVFYSILQRLLV